MLQKLARDALDNCIAGDVSAELGHCRLLAELGMNPSIDLGMRLGETSGAALTLGII